MLPREQQSVPLRFTPFVVSFVPFVFLYLFPSMIDFLRICHQGLVWCAHTTAIVVYFGRSVHVLYRGDKGERKGRAATVMFHNHSSSTPTPVAIAHSTADCCPGTPPSKTALDVCRGGNAILLVVVVEAGRLSK